MTRHAFRSTLEDILGVPRGMLSDADTRQTIGTWTSLADVQIVIVMTGDLGLDDDAETLEYDSVGDLMAVLDGRGAFEG
jgi:hypothetical protein